VIQLYQRGIKNVVASSGTALTQEQIRLIRRLTPNVTILYDGDAAGLRAAIRGVDLILAEGMNVRICTFPEGEDPDSFAKSNSLEEIQAYFSEHTQDFIRFKASLLIEEAQDDPMKRADTIRSMIESISKISDPIKREIYVRECAKIMEISEEVLFASLAQMNQQQLLKAQQEMKRAQKETPMAAVKTPERLPPIAYLEKDLIKYLLLYGPKECVFEDKFIYYDPETGEEKVQEISQKAKVYEKLFLELQADEIELSTAEFKEIYTFFIDKYQHGLEDISTIINELPVSMASIIATFQAQQEEIRLHSWSDKGVEVKQPKEADLSYAINGIILNLRKILINKKIEELRAEIIQLEAEKGDPTWAIQEIMEYNVLRNTISRRLGSN
jgi:putative DNA primase